MQARVIIAIVALVVVVGGGIWWWQTSQAPAAPIPVAIAPEGPKKPIEDGEVPSTPDVQRVVLPALEASDGYVREEVSLIAPQMSEWLKQENVRIEYA